MAGKTTQVKDVNQAGEKGDAPALENENRGAPAPSGGQAGQRKRVYVRVRYYVGANARLTFYIPTKNGVVKEKVLIMDQKWASEIIKYIKTKGKYHEVTRVGYSRLWHTALDYRNDVWTAKIPAKKLLGMIKASKTWSRSEHASKIVQLLEQVVRHG
jgi:hypothetical protein